MNADLLNSIPLPLVQHDAESPEERSVAKLCEMMQIPQPLQFLGYIMSGQDPRHESRLYGFITELENFYHGGDLPADEFCELVGRIQQYHRYKPVSLTESMGAANTISQYLHSKKASIKVDGAVATNAELQALTEDEVDLFMEKWDNEY